MATTPVQVRLPDWAESFVERRAAEHRTTKTAVILEAIGCLRATDLEEQMREGYTEMASLLAEEAESGMAAGNETLPDW